MQWPEIVDAVAMDSDFLQHILAAVGAARPSLESQTALNQAGVLRLASIPMLIQILRSITVDDQATVRLHLIQARHNWPEV
jgi:hypothetical protein